MPLLSHRPGDCVSLPGDTERLVFRWWREDDLPLATELWGDPRVTALIDARPRLDEAAVRERLQRELRRERELGYQYWPVFLREGARFIGVCGLQPRDGILEVGFHLKPDFWGHGYASEAARAVIAHAFDTLGASSLFAGHHPHNERSQRTLEKLGFRRTGQVFFPPTGLMHPAYLLER